MIWSPACLPGSPTSRSRRSRPSSKPAIVSIALAIERARPLPDACCAPTISRFALARRRPPDRPAEQVDGLTMIEVHAAELRSGRSAGSDQLPGHDRGSRRPCALVAAQEAAIVAAIGARRRDRAFGIHVEPLPAPADAGDPAATRVSAFWNAPRQSTGPSHSRGRRACGTTGVVAATASLRLVRPALPFPAPPVSTSRPIFRAISARQRNTGRTLRSRCRRR